MLRALQELGLRLEPGLQGAGAILQSSASFRRASEVTTWKERLASHFKVFEHQRVSGYRGRALGGMKLLVALGFIGYGSQ